MVPGHDAQQDPGGCGRTWRRPGASSPCSAPSGRRTPTASRPSPRAPGSWWSTTSPRPPWKWWPCCSRWSSTTWSSSPTRRAWTAGASPSPSPRARASRVPPCIPTVLDVGHRRIDISTFIELISRLRISDREVDRRLFRYSENNVSLDLGVNRQYRELFVKHTELDTVVNLAHEGILLLNAGGADRALQPGPVGDAGPPGRTSRGGPSMPWRRRSARPWRRSRGGGSGSLEHKGRSMVVTAGRDPGTSGPRREPASTSRRSPTSGSWSRT